MSDESRYITGQTIVIDGGMSAHVGVRAEADAEHSKPGGS